MNSTRSVKFYVDRKVLQAGALSVIGRCLEDSIEVGDQFESVYTMTPDEGGRPNSRPLLLRVERIEVWPSGVVDKLSSGFNGKLELTGAGGELIVDGEDILSSERGAACS